MKGQKIGYIRVSTRDQDPDLQLRDIELDRRFVEIASGKTHQRPELDILLEYVREGDVIYVQAIDRMARNVRDLRNIIDTLLKKKVRIEFIRESMVFCGDDSPLSILMLNLMGALAEFERNLMLERQREGIARAKREGKYRGGKNKLAPEQVKEIKERIAQGVTKARIAKDFKISRQTIYHYLNENKLYERNEELENRV
jgi:DNA invertase Pin-like site-specific DNA recombinase